MVVGSLKGHSHSKDFENNLFEFLQQLVGVLDFGIIDMFEFSGTRY